MQPTKSWPECLSICGYAHFKILLTVAVNFLSNAAALTCPIGKTLGFGSSYAGIQLSIAAPGQGRPQMKMSTQLKTFQASNETHTDAREGYSVETAKPTHKAVHATQRTLLGLLRRVHSFQDPLRHHHEALPPWPFPKQLCAQRHAAISEATIATRARATWRGEPFDRGR
jgi:hypothetical protein